MKRIAVITILAVGAAGAALGQPTVVGSSHDLSGALQGNTPEVCVYCHATHQAAAAMKQDPLWNHTAVPAATTYGVYASTTLNATPAEIGGTGVGGQSVSALCMSCHDGTIAPSSLYNPPNSGAPAAIPAITGNANLGTDLTDDHPINFAYDAALATADGGLKTPDSAMWVDAANTVPLFGTTVQCASCHDPHDPTNTPFLVKSNNASALCTTCHNK